MRRFAYMAGVLLLVIGLSGCGKKRSSCGDDNPNVVVIVIDTLRADHLAFYGYSEHTASFLEELAEKCVIFDKAYAPSSWTAPATASLFTSTYPSQHGVLLGDRYYRGDNIEPLPTLLNRIPAALQTLPELMQAQGYMTYGVSDNYFVSAACGFARGFDRFIQFNYNGADAVNEVLMRWKDDIVYNDEPYFLYIHYVDPHWPYHIRRPWYNEYGEGTASERAYDSEIGYVDDRIRQVFEAYGLDDDAIVIVTSDHGEEFGDHGGEGHRFKLYQELIHVPLMIYFPGNGPEPHRVKAGVSLVDILPTLRELTGAPPNDQDVGISLSTTMNSGDADMEERYMFSMRTKEADVRLGEKRAVVHGIEKLILNSPEDSQEYYNLAADPHEQVNLARKKQPQVERLEDALDAFEDGATIYERETVDLGELSPDLKEQLKSLGYLH